MPLENLDTLADLARDKSIAIRVLAWGYAPLLTAIVAQWLAAIKAKDEYRKDIKQLSDKFDEGLKNAFSYISKFSDALKQATTKLEIMLDRSGRADRD